MKQEAKETLEKQLQLLSERSNEATPHKTWQHKFNAMIGALQAVGTENPEKAEKLKKAIHAAIERMGEMA